MKAYEELKQKGIKECIECRYPTGEDWEYADFSDKTVVRCPRCEKEIYLGKLFNFC